MSDSIWYPTCGSKAQVFGPGPLEDQQLAGLVMWLPGGLAYIIEGLALCAHRLGDTRPGRAVQDLAAAGTER